MKLDYHKSGLMTDSAPINLFLDLSFYFLIGAITALVFGKRKAYLMSSKTTSSAKLKRIDLLIVI
jgi:hypothetical protein